MFFLPFASWMVPRDVRNPSASSSEEDSIKKGEDKKDKKDEKDKKYKKRTTKAKPGPRIGSGIVVHDDKGIPYWTNGVSDEATYRLLVQQTNHPSMPLKLVGDSKLPPWKVPLAVPPPSNKENTKKSGDGKGRNNNCSKTKKKKDKEGGGGGGGGGNNDDSITRMGIWEELFDAVNGTKIWYNTVTQKKTSKDPFF